MKLTLNESAIRLALFIFNFIFSLLGIALVALGIVYSDDLWWLRNYIALDLLHLSTLIIVLGCLSFGLSIVGCIFAKSENLRFFHLYIWSLVVLLLMDLSIVVISFINMAEDREVRTKSIMAGQLINGTDTLIKPTFYDIEEHYECCGIDSVEDYLEQDYVAQYCCTDENNECTLDYANATDLIDLEGCAYVVLDEIQRISGEAGFYTSIISALQAAELVCGLVLVAATDHLI